MNSETTKGRTRRSRNRRVLEATQKVLSQLYIGQANWRDNKYYGSKGVDRAEVWDLKDLMRARGKDLLDSFTTKYPRALLGLSLQPSDAKETLLTSAARRQRGKWRQNKLLSTIISAGVAKEFGVGNCGEHAAVMFDELLKVAEEGEVVR